MHRSAAVATDPRDSVLADLLDGHISCSDLPQCQIDDLMFRLNEVLQHAELGAHGEVAALCLEILDNNSHLFLDPLNMEDLEQGIVQAEINNTGTYCHPTRVVIQ